MKTNTAYAILAVITVIGMSSMSSALASAHDDTPISVWSDSSSYNHESQIKIDGKVVNIRDGVPVTLVVTAPNGNIVTLAQLSVDSDGMFGTMLSTEGALWKYDGSYTVRVQYGTQEVNNWVTVELMGGITPDVSIPAPTCSSNELPVGDQCVPYNISDGMVTGSILTDYNSIIITVDNNAEGTFTLDTPDGAIDGVFMVLVDDQEWDDVEISDNEVTVMFPYGTEKIEVIGTFVIPEFGTIAVLILAVAIVSIVAVSTRSKLSIMPKY